MTGQKSPYGIWVILTLILIALSYIPLFLDERTLDAFVREDRIYEMLSAVYLLVSSILFAVAFFRSKVKFNLKDPAWIRKWMFLGFALLFFVAAGEEISWGQRMFGFETPNLIKERNVQKELTLHNLNIFQGEDALIPMTAGRAIQWFALAFGAAIPLAARLIKAIGRFLERIFPVLPVGFSLVFLVNYGIQKLFLRLLPIYPQLYHHTTLKPPAAIHEVREHGYEFGLMMAVIFYVLVKLREQQAGPLTSEAQAAARPAEGD
ncbi:MAG: hypothetical protein ACM3QS_01255 [Bacteroidota bacterium]